MIRVRATIDALDDIQPLLGNLHPPLFLTHKEELDDQICDLTLDSVYLPDDLENEYKLWITKTKYDEAPEAFYTWKVEKVNDTDSLRSSGKD
jgi:hypothetical protein